MRKLPRSWVWAPAVAFATCGVLLAQDPPPERPHPDLPQEFKQMIPRGTIASVDEPRFVAANEAEIPGDAWVLGVEIDGVVKAYSLNLLNRHEVVNDRFGDLPVAAVW